LEGEEGGNGC